MVWGYGVIELAELTKLCGYIIKCVYILAWGKSGKLPNFYF